jgi:phage major head subunit gpT-like protein
MDRPDDEHVFMRKKFRYGVDDRKNVGFGLWQLAYGSKQALDGTAYGNARAANMSFNKDEAVPLGIIPTHLVWARPESAGRRSRDADHHRRRRQQVVQHREARGGALAA